LAGLHRIAAGASQSLDVAEILASTLGLVAALVDMRGGAAYAFDDAGHDLEVAARYGAVEERTGETLPEVDERRIVNAVARDRKAVFCDDVTKDRSLTRSCARPVGRGSFIAVPLMSKNRAVGVICLTDPQPKSFTDEDRDLVTSAGAEIGVAVDNAMLYEEAGRRGVELLLLHETGQLFASSVDEEILFASIVKHCADSFEADLCMLGSVANDRFQLQVVHCDDDEDRAVFDRLVANQIETKKSVLEPVLKTGEARSLVLAEADRPAEVDRPADGLDRCLSGRAWLIVPVPCHRAIIGMIMMARNDPSRKFTSRELFVMEEIASQLGRAVERLRLFEEIEESELKYRSLVERASDGVFLCDSAGRIIFASGKMAEITGKSLESLLNSSVDRMFDPDSAPAMMEAIADVVASPDKTLIVGGAVNGRSGEKVPVQVGYAGLDVFDGVAAVQGIVRDLRQELEGEQLKSDLVSMVSHELRSPLTLIAGYGAMLRRDDLVLDPEKRQTAIKAIETQVRRMLELVEQLLLASRFEHGAVAVSRQPTDLEAVVRRFADAYAASNERHSIEVDFAKRFPKVNVDLHGFEQVIANLLSNAVKYSPEGGMVVISGAVEGGCVLISVRDEGIGIEEREQERIFDRFYQADMTSTRSYGGIGLGLFIAKSIIEAHGGTINVDSNAGGGSTFSFTLPLDGSGDGDGRVRDAGGRSSRRNEVRERKS
jgi:PAS domain S-box-containing protein